jgi:hypothetical protein
MTALNALDGVHVNPNSPVLPLFAAVIWSRARKVRVLRFVDDLDAGERDEFAAHDGERSMCVLHERLGQVEIGAAGERIRFDDVGIRTRRDVHHAAEALLRLAGDRESGLVDGEAVLVKIEHAARNAALEFARRRQMLVCAVDVSRDGDAGRVEQVGQLRG